MYVYIYICYNIIIDSMLRAVVSIIDSRCVIIMIVIFIMLYHY